jgi:hypothetical protein
VAPPGQLLAFQERIVGEDDRPDAPGVDWGQQRMTADVFNQAEIDAAA